jgi:hypothetical protein
MQFNFATICALVCDSHAKILAARAVQQQQCEQIAATSEHMSSADVSSALSQKWSPLCVKQLVQTEGVTVKQVLAGSWQALFSCQNGKRCRDVF